MEKRTKEWMERERESFFRGRKEGEGTRTVISKTCLLWEREGKIGGKEWKDMVNERQLNVES